MQYLKDEVKNRILGSALAEFKSMGYSDASMRKIAKDARVALGNVYHYYTNKQELFNALVGSVYDRLITSIQEINRIGLKDANEYQFMPKSDETGYYGINELVSTLLGICKEHNIELLILLDKSKGCKSKYEDTKQDLIDMLDEVLRDKMLRNLKDSQIEVRNPYIVYILSASFIEGLCNILRKYENGSEVKLLVDELITIFFKDIASRF
ncbi:MAG: TetR/AcrR family transcriptional regulator [Clostridia bacterium]|nr:TetR/AcrR family transcriptional regulator [Clostridia bacterium]